MNRSTAQTKQSTRQDRSLGGLLLVWFLVGFSLAGLGLDLHRALSVSIPVSPVSGGLLFGTVVVVVLWIAGFRPSLQASTAYFLTQSAVHLLLVLAIGSATAEPWRDVSIRVLSISVAAAVSFTDVGRRLRNWVRQRSWRLLQSLAAG